MLTVNPLSQSAVFPSEGTLKVYLEAGVAKAVAVPSLNWAVQIVLGTATSVLVEITATDPSTVKDDGSGASWNPLDSAYTVNSYIISYYPVAGIRLTAIGGTATCSVIARSK